MSPDQLSQIVSYSLSNKEIVLCDMKKEKETPIKLAKISQISFFHLSVTSKSKT